MNVSKAIPIGEHLSTIRQKRGERGIWQRRFWEHIIRDDLDLRQHMDYIHYNPVKHDLVTCVKNWPYSTFHHLVKQGAYEMNWGENIAPDLMVDAHFD